MTRKTGTAYRITCPNDYPIEHEMGPCTVLAVTDTKLLVSFGACATGYDVVHRYEAAVASVLRKKFDAGLKPLLLPPPTVAGEPRASFSLLPDTLVFHESPDDVRDIKCVEPGATVRVIVQFIGIRRADGGWELDTAVTQVYIPPAKKSAAAEDGATEGAATEGAATEGAATEGAEDKATQADDGSGDDDEARREEARRADAEEARKAEGREMDEMLTTEVEQDVESFLIG